MPTICSTCGTPAPENAVFCERDGTRLQNTVSTPSTPDSQHAAATYARTNGAATAAVAVPAGCRCGAEPDLRVDGYCSACGHKWVEPRKPLPRDHVERALSPAFGGVTDRGQRHTRNEDDFALSLTDGGDAVMIVCDGVSSSEEADRASAVAAKTINDRLSTASADREAALRGAIAAANTAVCALYSAKPGATSAPPETTVVAAIVRGRAATIAWVGDSRAYWIDGADTTAARQLTRDHSWMNDVVDSGEMTMDEARGNRLAHAITRCLGAADDPGGSEPSLVSFVFPEAGGFLLLCSDGLWNYADSLALIAGLVHTAPRTADAVTLSRSLVAWANTQGGRDNITATLLAVPAAGRSLPAVVVRAAPAAVPEKENL